MMQFQVLVYGQTYLWEQLVLTATVANLDSCANNVMIGEKMDSIRLQINTHYWCAAYTDAGDYGFGSIKTDIEVSASNSIRR
jgi:hypothetical protein